MRIINIKKLAFLQNLIKAYTEGIYADTPANRKLGRVGMSYKEYAEKQKGGEDKKNVEKKEEEVRSGEKYLEKEEDNTLNREKQEEKAKEINNFLKIFDTHKNTFAYMYAANSLDNQFAKEYVNSEGKREENPMLGKVYKVTTYKFQFGNTYKEAVKRKNPDWEVQQKKGGKVKVEDYDLVYFSKKGNLIFPVVDYTSTSKYYMKDDSGKMKEISLQDLQPYLKPSSSLYLANKSEKKKSNGSGIKYRDINVDKIYKLNAGGKSWSNKDFIYSELNSVIKNN